jgi:hypothetical protein
MDPLRLPAHRSDAIGLLLALPAVLVPIVLFAVAAQGGLQLALSTTVLIGVGCLGVVGGVGWWFHPRCELQLEGDRLGVTRGFRTLHLELPGASWHLTRWVVPPVGLTGSVLHLEANGKRLSIGSRRLFEDPARYQPQSSRECDIWMEEAAFDALLEAIAAQASEVAGHRAAEVSGPQPVSMDLNPWSGVGAPALTFPLLIVAGWISAGAVVVAGHLLSIDEGILTTVGPILMVGLPAGGFFWLRSRRPRPLRLWLAGDELWVTREATGEELARTPVRRLVVHRLRFWAGSKAVRGRPRHFPGLELELPGLGALRLGAVSEPWPDDGALPRVSTPPYQVGPAELALLVRALGLRPTAAPSAARGC